MGFFPSLGICRGDEILSSNALHQITVVLGPQQQCRPKCAPPRHPKSQRSHALCAPLVLIKGESECPPHARASAAHERFGTFLVYRIAYIVMRWSALTPASTARKVALPQVTLNVDTYVTYVTHTTLSLSICLLPLGCRLSTWTRCRSLAQINLIKIEVNICLAHRSFKSINRPTFATKCLLALTPINHNRITIMITIELTNIGG